MPPNINKEVINYAFSQRKLLKAKNDTHLLMGFAWIIPDEYKRFKKCHEVIHVDGIIPTNMEKYIMITVSAKDRSGKMVTILQDFFLTSGTGYLNGYSAMYSQLF